MVISPLRLPAMHVLAAILQDQNAGRDSPSIAHAAMAACSELISVTAVYRTLDYLEHRHLVALEPSKDLGVVARKNRCYKATIEGIKIFELSLGFQPLGERARLAPLQARDLQRSGCTAFGVTDDAGNT